jgi:hypothetical protein
VHVLGVRRLFVRPLPLSHFAPPLNIGTLLTRKFSVTCWYKTPIAGGTPRQGKRKMCIYRCSKTLPNSATAFLSSRRMEYLIWIAQTDDFYYGIGGSEILQKMLPTPPAHAHGHTHTATADTVRFFRFLEPCVPTARHAHFCAAVDPYGHNPAQFEPQHPPIEFSKIPPIPRYWRLWAA